MMMKQYIGKRVGDRQKEHWPGQIRDGPDGRQSESVVAICGHRNYVFDNSCCYATPPAQTTMMDIIMRGWPRLSKQSRNSTTLLLICILPSHTARICTQIWPSGSSSPQPRFITSASTTQQNSKSFVLSRISSSGYCALYYQIDARISPAFSLLIGTCDSFVPTFTFEYGCISDCPLTYMCLGIS